jgi:hypothetical protein
VKNYLDFDDAHPFLCHKTVPSCAKYALTQRISVLRTMLFIPFSFSKPSAFKPLKIQYHCVYDYKSVVTLTSLVQNFLPAPAFINASGVIY